MIARGWAQRTALRAKIPLQRCVVQCGQGFDPNPKPLKKPKSRVKTAMETDTKIEAAEEPVVQREVPSYVANRILTRIAVFSGVPVFLGICLLPVFYYLKAVKTIDVPTWLVYLSQFFTFGGGLLGISYAILSSSDASQDDFLGFETFKSNVKGMFGRKG